MSFPSFGNWLVEQRRLAVVLHPAKPAPLAGSPEFVGFTLAARSRLGELRLDRTHSRHFQGVPRPMLNFAATAA